MSDENLSPIEQPKATDWSDLPSLYAKRREKRIAEERDSQPIGSLANRIASSPEVLASALQALPSNSATTGTPSRAVVASNATGQLPGVIGAGALLTVEQAWQERDAEALESRLYRSLKPARTCLRPLSDANHELVGYEVTGKIPRETLETLRPLVEKITAPAGPGEAVKLITRLLQATKSRERDGQDIRGMIAVLAEDLAEFPIDVLATACRKHARQEKWWPSLSELREQCHRATKWRRSLQKALALTPPTGGPRR